MKRADEHRDVERDESEHKDEPDTTAGEVLGISRVPTGPTGEIDRVESEGTRGGATDDEGHVMPLEDSSDLGSRDVTRQGPGQTGPETGGHGATPQRSGATGSDIGS